MDNGWISVKDRLPECHTKSLCAVIIPDHGGCFVRDYEILCVEHLGASGWNCHGMIVTHWMPLPELPEVTQNG